MLKIYTLAAAALLPLSFAAAQQTLTLTDGTQYEGRLLSSTGRIIVFRDSDGNVRRLPVESLQDLNFNGGGPPPAAYGAPPPAGRYDRNSGYQQNGAYPTPPPYQANGPYPPNAPPAGYDQNRPPEPGYQTTTKTEVYRSGPQPTGDVWETLPEGTQVAVRTNEPISSRSATGGRTYAASIAQDIVAPDGRVVIPQGSDAQLVVRTIDNGVALDLQSISVNGQSYTVNSQDMRNNGNQREGIGANRRTGEYVGGGAVLGTLLGAIAGGGRGAAIGALAGGAAGAGTEVLTRGESVRVPAESVLTFRLDVPMQLYRARY